MSFTHRDHRARRELRQLYLGFGAAVGGLTLGAVLLPDGAIRLAAVAGLAAAGVVYLVAVDRLTDGYERDLIAVRAGAPISGEVRAEVYDEVGFERDRAEDWTPSPSRRHTEVGSDSLPSYDDAREPASTSPARSDPPSDAP